MCGLPNVQASGEVYVKAIRVADVPDSHPGNGWLRWLHWDVPFASNVTLKGSELRSEEARGDLYECTEITV